MATLIISNAETKDIMKVVKCLKEFGLLNKCTSKTNQNKVYKQKVNP